jgi:hypothetical protein
MSTIPQVAFTAPIKIDKEQVWNEFLSELLSHQLHRVLHNELELHDAYISGERQLMDIFASVAEEDDDPPQLFDSFS